MDPIDYTDVEQRPINGGDSFGRCGIMACFDRHNGWKYLVAAYSKCHRGEGLFCRHPLQIPGFAFWYDPCRLSRDNQIMVICGSGYHLERATVRSGLELMYSMQVARGWKMQNLDVCFPWVWNAYYRSLGIDKSLLWGDFTLLIDVVFRILDFSEEGHGRAMTMLPVVRHAVDMRPTWISRLAKWMFLKFRNVRKDYEIYYAPKTGAPPIHEVAAPYFKD